MPDRSYLVIFVLLQAVLVYLKEIDNPTTRISNNEIVDITNYPHQVGIVVEIQQEKTICCGGFLVTTTAVFSAINCIQNKLNLNLTLHNFSILIGGNYLDDPQGRLVGIRRITVHPSYPKVDFCVIILKNPVRLSKTVQLIQLNMRKVQEGALATVTGWGFTEKDVRSKELRNVTLKIMKGETCRLKFPHLESSLFCGKVTSGHPRKVDSGGAVIVNKMAAGVVIELIKESRIVLVLRFTKEIIGFAVQVEGFEEN